MIVPGVLVGLGSALVATTTGIERHWYTTAFATHVVYTLPFCFLVMLAIFNRFDSLGRGGGLVAGRLANHDLPQDHVPADLSRRALRDAVRFHAFL